MGSEKVAASLTTDVVSSNFISSATVQHVQVLIGYETLPLQGIFPP